MINAMVALAAGLGVLVVVLLAGIFLTEAWVGKNAEPTHELVGLVIVISVLSLLGTILVLL